MTIAQATRRLVAGFNHRRHPRRDRSRGVSVWKPATPQPTTTTTVVPTTALASAPLATYSGTGTQVVQTPELPENEPLVVKVDLHRSRGSRLHAHRIRRVG